MKKEISITDRPEKLAGYEAEQYFAACGNLSWYDFVTAMPSLVFLVTGWKSNGKENACLQSWSTFAGSGADNFICIMGKVNKGGHMYQSLKETRVCVLNFPSIDIYDRCIKTIGNNQFETEECFLNIECEFLWEHDLFEGSQEVAVALKAVSICIDSERYDQSKLGRYGKNGYLYQIDQPANPETGEITPINHGTLEPGVPIEWITN